MPNHEQIYSKEAISYERLISKQPTLHTVLYKLHPYDDLDVLDLGAGTGRLTCPLAKKAKSIIAMDQSKAMLEIVEEKLEELEKKQEIQQIRQKINKIQGTLKRCWSTIVGDHRQLPLGDKSVDLIVAGWTICYLASSNHDRWQQNLQEIMDECQRVLRPGGKIIIFETLGTGYTEPNPPQFLQPYYSALENQYKFQFQWLRMDYTFDSVEEAEMLTRFFFGDELAEQVIQNEWRVVPECAGIWHLEIN